ncbi:MAG: electron transfer flavoprotein subunit beta/FixA family protein [Nitrospirae bacterium]|nr:electron transfer flavoprotein subunit beta/FixA family protein [Nitrospirota bacterium]
MKIIVLLKPIPDLSNIKISKGRGLVFELNPRIMNPADRNALEFALSIKDKMPSEITAITLGDEKTGSLLKEAIAMGADKGILLEDAAFAEGDGLANAYVLSLAIKKLGSFDLIICGNTAEDDTIGEVGPRLAEIFNVEQATFVTALSSILDKKINVDRLTGVDSHSNIEIDMPAVVAVNKDSNKPRVPSAIKIMKAAKAEIIKWSAQDIGADTAKCGAAGSAIRITNTFVPEG